MKYLVFKNSDGKLVTNSLLVAEKFNKRHDHVLLSIESLILTTQKFGALFVSTTYEDVKGEFRPMYIMNRDGFSLLVMGFTRKDALKFKLDFIEAFNTMEAHIKEQQKPLSTLDLLELPIRGMRETGQELQEVKRDVLELKVKTQTRPDYFTIVGYGTLHHISFSFKQASILGRRVTKLCQQRGITTDRIPDPRFGMVKMYPSEVLEEVFNQPII